MVPLYRLKGFLKAFISICSRVQFGKCSVLMKCLMELKLEWPLFSRVNNFQREKNYLRTLLYFIGGKRETLLGWGGRERGVENSCVVGTIAYSFDLQKAGWMFAVVCQMSLLVFLNLRLPLWRPEAPNLVCATNDMCKYCYLYVF